MNRGPTLKGHDRRMDPTVIEGGADEPTRREGCRTGTGEGPGTLSPEPRELHRGRSSELEFSEGLPSSFTVDVESRDGTSDVPGDLRFPTSPGRDPSGRGTLSSSPHVGRRTLPVVTRGPSPSGGPSPGLFVVPETSDRYPLLGRRLWVRPGPVTVKKALPETPTAERAGNRVGSDTRPLRDPDG